MSSTGDISIADVPKKFPSLAERFNELDQIASNKEPTFPPIGKAPFMLRDDSKLKYFEPRAVALGPVHHDNPKYKLAEEFKLILTAEFIRNINCPRETLFETIKNNIEKWKNCYEEDVRKKYVNKEDGDKLAWMLLVDGCAVLQFIQSANDDTLEKMVKNNLSVFAVHDLFLLENQLPFELLEELMRFHKDGKEMFLKSIRSFVDQNIGLTSKKEWNVLSKPNHLLDLLRARMILCPSKIEEPKKPDQGLPPSKIEEPKKPDQGLPRFRFPKKSGGDPSHANDNSNDHTSITVDDTNQQSKGAGTHSHKNGTGTRRHTNEGSPSHTNDFLPPQSTNKFVANTCQHKPQPNTKETDNQGASDQSGSKGEDRKIGWETFRNVMELKAAGIHAKPSKTNCLRDFDYEDGNLWFGTMKMPCIRVDDSTVPKFLNMIAYEMHPQFENQGEVGSYICLMDRLIDDADDVKELRKVKILHNMLGSDQEVADVFNTISTDLVPNPEYKVFLKKIQTHCDNTWKTSFAQTIHEHFSTPWTKVAFVGALIGLILSAIQASSVFIN